MSPADPRGVHPLRRLAAVSWTERATLAEALIFLGLARVAVILLPFRVIARRLGDHMKESDAVGDPAATEVGRRIGWAIGAVARYAPWRTKCLEQALAAKAMLRLRGIPNTMYLGVAPGQHEDAPFGAHAWLRTGTLHVTGGSHVERFTVLSTFADGGRQRRGR